MVTDVERHDLAEQTLAQLRLGPPRFAKRKESAKGGEEPNDDSCAGDEPGPHPDVVIAVDASVNAESEESWHSDLARHPCQSDEGADNQVTSLL